MLCGVKGDMLVRDGVQTWAQLPSSSSCVSMVRVSMVRRTETLVRRPCRGRVAACENITQQKNQATHAKRGKKNSDKAATVWGGTVWTAPVPKESVTKLHVSPVVVVQTSWLLHQNYITQRKRCCG